MHDDGCKVRIPKTMDTARYVTFVADGRWLVTPFRKEEGMLARRTAGPAGPATAIARAGARDGVKLAAGKLSGLAAVAGLAPAGCGRRGRERWEHAVTAVLSAGRRGAGRGGAGRRLWVRWWRGRAAHDGGRADQRTAAAGSGHANGVRGRPGDRHAAAPGRSVRGDGQFVRRRTGHRPRHRGWLLPFGA
ncbi:hypothetical protein FAGKG844_100027 [Frankia sp. AgKG'84/4]